jgi:hypothetical protein
MEQVSMPVQGSLIGLDMLFFSSKANNLSMIEKKIKFSSFIRKFRVEQLQRAS